MTLNNILFILLGAGLVTVGFLAAALAERLRGAPALEIPARQETRRQERRTPLITIDEPAEMPRSRAPAPRETPDEPAEVLRTPTVTRAASRASRQAAPSPGDDVVTALMAAGYKRPMATEATWGCGEAERVTIEHWTAAALRRCGRGA